MNQVPGKNADFVKVFGPRALSATMGEYKINPDGTYTYHGLTAKYQGISLDEVARKLSVYDGMGVICVGVEGNTEVQMGEQEATTLAASGVVQAQESLPAGNPDVNPAPTTDAYTKGVEQTDTTDPELEAARGPTPEQHKSLLERMEEAAGHVLVQVMDTAEATAAVLTEHPWAVLEDVKNGIEARVKTLFAEGEEAKKRLTGDTVQGGAESGLTAGSATGTLTLDADSREADGGNALGSDAPGAQAGDANKP